MLFEMIHRKGPIGRGFRRLFLVGWLLWACSVGAGSPHPLVGILAGQPVAMWLTESDRKVTGTYYYYEVGQPIELTGTRTETGHYRLEERVDGKVTGSLHISPEKEPGFWAGTWSAPGSAKSFPLTLMNVGRTGEQLSGVKPLAGEESLVSPRRFYSRPLAVSWLKKHCLPFATGYLESVQSQCRVLRFDRFGQIGDEQYDYALYRHVISLDPVWKTGESIYDSPPYHQTALFLFAGPAGDL